MTRLYTLSAEYARLQEAADDGEDVEAALSALSDELALKAERVSYVLRNLGADDDALTAEIKRLTARRDAVRKADERLRTYLRDCMEGAGLHSVRSASLSITLSDGPESVEVCDDAAVPDEYVRVKREVNKRAVLDAWKNAGECVPGTEIKRGKTLRIR